MIWIIILGLLGTFVISALSWYALCLLKKLKQQKQAFLQAKMQRTTRLKESIETIARAMKSKECNHSEGVIRLAMLLMPFGKNLQPYPAMMQLYEIVQDMPTHDARKALEKQERMRLDLKRESAEAKFEQEILEELSQLLDDVKKFGVL
ncbi:DUF2489 domain-containing protein [Rodentibacter pneumotropicus]|uniref:DUF2489 domain-containing protein n=1 Tax=Rodentibacter pneumotropicus TaxID=758 RepID=UPI0003785B9A|nr:DUF2489 domain-containing protein [Rodentibacter pneumotropicus]NBH76349.1 DUF2489 domain-containing protein [Rodentibacter pneumotropicus]OOF64875.1 hypothetical protein BH925_06050 [Rodentibacter pneumotropicus]THA03654.1 DUF2489 domain-containing protein [Rodentibacter pneumotropicus]THA07650.1 DUF2489 domain-containing protein [Rodentibacter pneumotropicus]THA10830.1 DUF2489 domain-containing protein [Rodentibacter pneumotropicus]